MIIWFPLFLHVFLYSFWYKCQPETDDPGPVAEPFPQKLQKAWHDDLCGSVKDSSWITAFLLNPDLHEWEWRPRIWVMMMMMMMDGDND